MGLKKRLLVAFAIIILVPILLAGTVTAAVLGFNYRNLEKGPMSTEDGETIYYVVRSGPSAPRMELPVRQTIVLIGLIILLTAFITVVWLYRSLIRPLNVLRMATANMKQGNLDFTISGNPDDELGQLCEEFEEMRVRLKEQIDARMKYEQDTIELISNISHDLKTPLTAIKGYAEGIIDGVADTEEKRSKYVRTIYTKASDMSVLVDELSLYSKIDSNIIPYNFDKVDINAYFTDCVEEQSLDMEVKGITMEFASEVPAGTFVKADSEQLRRVVNNIIGNAVKYMNKPSGSIKIRLIPLKCCVKVEIEDNGPGIDENDLAHIFERFYRADSSRGTRKGGSGLGLAIVKKIIEDHGGKVGAESTPGEGSTFFFTLPIYTENNTICEEVEDAEYSALPENGPQPEKGGREE
ncbi:MAG: HAMP domain-containing histidine kinase [Lachnospiraceae bacterium]|nr:HAMP domain-containing histidine kinase [Lachnospiraceae bacterium]